MIRRLLISGYKAHELGIYKDSHPGVRYIKKALESKLRPLIERGLEWCVVSGQSGVELWAAEVVLALKQEHPDLNLAVITPFLGQEERWKPERQEAYRSICRQADFTASIYKGPYEGPWQFARKHQFLLKHTDALLLLFDEQGSPQHLKRAADARAQHADYEVITLTSHDLQLMLEEEALNLDPA